MSDSIDQQRAREPGRGRDADSPRSIPFEGWKDILLRVAKGIGANRVPLTAAGVTYFLLLSSAPTLSVFVTFYGLFNSPQTVVEQLQLLQGVVPEGGLEIIEDQLVRLTAQDSQTLGLTLIISIGAALWTAGAGIKALFEAMNVAYREEEKRGFIHLNLLALAFIFCGMLGVVVALTAVLVVPILMTFLPQLGDLGWVVRLAAYLIMIIAFILGLAGLYRWGPSRHDARWCWVTPGSIFAAATVGIASVLFSWYVANFGNYNATYGSLGALIGLMTWIWLSVIIVVLGGSLNSEIEHQTARDSTTGDMRPLGERGAYVADTVGRSTKEPAD